MSVVELDRAAREPRREGPADDRREDGETLWGVVAGAGAAHASDFAADYARRILGARRRSSEVRVLPGNVVAKADMMIASICLYDEDGLPFWKPFGEATPKDLERKAKMLDSLAIGVLRRSRWYRECAELATAEGAKTMGRVKADLPALPDAEDIEL